MSAPLAFGPREVHVWMVPLGLGAAAVGCLAALLSEPERARARRYAFDAPRRQFIVARAALRVLLGRYLGRPARTIRFRYGSSGKPYVIASGEAPYFNVSHSHGLAALAFSGESELGIDIEHVRETAGPEPIVRRFFCAEEAAEWLALAPGLRSRGFFDCWTRKEAYVKAVGQGLEVPLDSFRVAFRPEDPPAISFRDDRRRERWSLFDVSPSDGYAAALAVRGSWWTVKCCRLELGRLTL